MPSYLPYIILAALCTILLVWTLFQCRQKYAIFIMFLAIVGMIYIFELVILVILDCYRYSPHFVRIPYQDNILGSVVSNMIAVPALALLIAVYQLRFRWIFTIILVLAGIEWAFLKWGIYRLNWWRIPYTSVSLLIFFPLTRGWLRRLPRGPGWLRFLTLYLGSFSLNATLMFVMADLGTRLYVSGVFEDVYRDDVFTASPFAFIMTVLFVSAAFFSRRIWPKLIALLLVFAINYASIRLGVLQVYIPLWSYYAVIVPICTLLQWAIARADRTLAEFRNPIVK